MTISKKDYKVCGIYKITNISNNKVYIGSSVNCQNRIHKHLWRLKENCHHSDHLQNAWNKYGESSFIFEVVCCIFDEKNLIQTEQYFIDLYNSYDKKYGYNMSKFADRVEMTESVRKKLSERQIGSKNHRFGKKWNNEYIEYFRSASTGTNNAFYGKHHTNETKQKISSAISGEKHHNYGKSLKESTKIKIRQKYKINEFICLQNEKIYNSTGDAARDLNLRCPEVKRCLKKSGQSTKGYSFKYIGD